MNLEKLHRVSVRLSRWLAADALYLTILALAIFVWFEMTVVYATLMVINDRWPAWICAPMFITQACFIVFTMAGYGLALDTPHEALRPMTDVGASELKLSPSVPPSESPEPSVTPESFLRRMKFAPFAPFVADGSDAASWSSMFQLGCEASVISVENGVKSGDFRTLFDVLGRTSAAAMAWYTLLESRRMNRGLVELANVVDGKTLPSPAEIWRRMAERGGDERSVLTPEELVDLLELASSGKLPETCACFRLGTASAERAQ